MIDFVSPRTGQPLAETNGQLVSGSGESFPIVRGIPRFVPADNYAAAFGLQWKVFATTQLDSRSGTNVSQERLERCLGFGIHGLAGKSVLEVGCGAGRFTELLIKGGAKTHSIDLSEAVEANKENMGLAAYSLAQASVYEMPFPDEAFDVVFCLGVIQHTPSSERTIEALWKKLKPGGLLVIDHYILRPGYFTTLTPVFRFFLKRMKPEHSRRIVESLVRFFFPLHWKFRDLPLLNWLLHRVSPLIEYIRVFPEWTRETHFEWSRLDTYDQLTDYYKHLKTPGQIRRLLEQLGGKEIWVQKGGNGIEARCRK
jgi:SAM-dependent methyltransferase